MANAISTGQITLVDLTDQRTSSFYLQANQSKIQILDVNKETNKYEPDYTTAAGSIKITPAFFFGNDDNTNKLNETNLKYTINGTEVKSISSTATTSDAFYQEGNQLIIQENIGNGEFVNFTSLRIVATIAANGIEDSKTGLKNDKAIEATIEFALVRTGEDGATGAAGISVVNVTQEYALSSSSTQAPDEKSDEWKPSNPTWIKDRYLWIRTKIEYSNGQIEYTTPYCDSSWKIAADGVASLNSELDSIKGTLETMQGEIDGAIETWYLPGDPTKEGFTNPWANTGDTDEQHIGDLYFDTETGKSYRFFKENETYKWQIISDTELSDAIKNIETLRTDVDSKVTIFYTEIDDETISPRVDDLLINSEGIFYQYQKNGEKYEWVLASYSIETVIMQYAQTDSNTVEPLSEDWKTESPQWIPGKYIWQRTVTYYKDGVKDPDYSKAICISAAAARSIAISGEQVFKSTDGTNYFPLNITLTANLVGGLTIKGWYYKTADSWTSLNSTESSINIAPTHPAFNGSTVATIKVESNEDASFYDVLSLYKVTDGQKGEDGEDGVTPKSVFLTNENITFAANAEGQVAARTVTCNVVAYDGVTKVTPTIGTITGGLSNQLTITAGMPIGNEIPLSITVAANATLGGAEERSGVISIPITSPVETILTINWSKVNTGATGAAGAAGADAIQALVETTDGRIIFTDNNPNNITLQAKLLVGGKIQTENVTYSWTGIPQIETNAVLSTNSTLEVNRDDVPSARSFVCTISYKGNSYIHSIAITDKKDPVYIVIESSAGDKFTNGNVNTTLTCKVYDANGEVDIVGSKYTYTWEKFDKNGNKVEWADKTTEKLGKVISVTSNDVDSKNIFSCSITENK